MEVEGIWREASRLHAQGKLHEAAQLFESLHQVNPAHPLPVYMLGVIAGQQGRNHKALDLLAHAAAMAPDHPAVQADYANALRLTGQADTALALLEKLLARDPDFAPALRHRAYILQSRGQAIAALADFDKALAQDGRQSELWFDSGCLLDELERREEALARFDRAVALAPGNASARNYRGWARLQLSQFEGALADFLQVTRSNPALAGGHFNLGLYWLLMGDFARGLPLFEWRMQLPGQSFVRPFREPRWTGAESLEGKILLVHGEQGLGDAIQFCRFLHLLKDRGGEIILALPKKLHRLLRDLPVTLCEAPPPAFDYQIPLMSLPLALGIRLESIASTPYLAAEPERIAHWRDRLGQQGRRIGICWHGLYGSGARDKCFPLAALEPLSRLPGVRLISLQKGRSTPELDRPPPGMALEVYDELDDGPDAFVDTAAVIANCDLVITADSAPAHLAGALGVPCWVALKHVPDWRWLLHRADTPWYDGMRLFRQPRRGDWDSVFAAMMQAL